MNRALASVTRRIRIHLIIIRLTPHFLVIATATIVTWLSYPLQASCHHHRRLAFYQYDITSFHFKPRGPKIDRKDSTLFL